MEKNPSDERIDVLKKDGSDMFIEGDISGATDMYIAAMRLEMDQHIQELLTPKQQGSDRNNNISNEALSEISNKDSTDGINSVISATLHSADEAIRINPSLPKPYKSKATALILQNKWDEAREVYLAGIKSCDDCKELRQALQALHKTQTLLETTPQVQERTRSVSSDTSESTFDGRSPTSKARRFRLQHRKKLSRPMVGLVMSTSIQSLKSSLEDDDDNEQDVITTNTTP
ncbi:uncharacterized protein LOC116306301 [Actinia tenebrosa]|uniref:Uncharacterized protein LOC116306301 n=1 Tax=Actinia tenebrosa TaxID=6105 RepID=A0A6P8J263_ACTTE|nr:uncharacterized protein LOC116306301 [Actinia tenebrosa]